MTKTPAPDARVKKTVERLEDALFELLADNELDEISVTRLCARANVSRSTFYSYFRSAKELHQFLLDRHIEAFRRELSHQWKSTKDIRSFYTQLLRYVRSKKAAFTCLYTKDYGGGLIDASLPLISMSAMSVKYPGISELDHEQVRVFNSYGCHGIIKQWLLRDCEEPIEEISELLFRYTVRILCLHPEAPERTGKL